MRITELTKALVICCAMALTASLSPAQIFANETLTRGLSGSATLGFQAFGVGGAFADFNGDDFPDILLGRSPTSSFQLFINDGAGSFSLSTSPLPLAGFLKGMCVGDIDNDGDLDVYVSRNLPSSNALLINDGTGGFTDQAAVLGVDATVNGITPTFIDIEGDGDLDIYVGVYSGIPGPNAAPNLLYVNQGGSFTEEAALRGATNLGGLAFQVLAFDKDGDGDQDLYIANDRGALPGTRTNALLENDGFGFFTDVSAATATDTGMDAMSADITDVNLDGVPDIFATNNGNGHVFHCSQAAPSVYANEAVLRGVVGNRFAWGSIFLDFDNDGDEDLFVANPLQADFLFENDGSGIFTEVATTEGVASTGNSYVPMVADIEGDGDLDLLLISPGQLVTLYVNQGRPGQGSITVDPRSMAGASALGAKVSVTAGGRTVTQQVMSCNGFLGASPPRLHFGLGTLSQADEVLVIFPSGASIHRRNIPVGSLLRMQEGQSTGTLNLGQPNAWSLSWPGWAAASTPYQVIASVGATNQFLLPDGRRLGTEIDPLCLFILQGGAGLGSGFSGTLSPAGVGGFSINVPADPSLLGIAIRVGSVLLDPLAPVGIQAIDAGLAVSFQ